MPSQKPSESTGLIIYRYEQTLDGQVYAEVQLPTCDHPVWVEVEQLEALRASHDRSPTPEATQHPASTPEPAHGQGEPVESATLDDYDVSFATDPMRALAPATLRRWADAALEAWYGESEDAEVVTLPTPPTEEGSVEDLLQAFMLNARAAEA